MSFEGLEAGARGDDMAPLLLAQAGSCVLIVEARRRPQSSSLDQEAQVIVEIVA